ncbi:MAG TPA: glutamate cyclase domain-containing protein, partial [Gemmataceae bacterium]|nr:glutamate cyclase domain-containing protein [Gemmataceae bacterium]
MSDLVLDGIRKLIQEDVNSRGLQTIPDHNLVSSCYLDFPAACRHMAETPQLAVGIVTGFYIPAAQPPAGETDGPLGALFLARVLTRLGAKVVLATDDFCGPALHAGLIAAQLEKTVPLILLPNFAHAQRLTSEDYCRQFFNQAGNLTHLIALERPGPSHTPDSIRSPARQDDALLRQFAQEVPPDHHNRCHTMKGRDITAAMSPAHFLFENVTPKISTIGIGDGGNEIGMGKIPWNVVRDNVPGGGLVACRVPADYLIVCGISNWGAYGLASGLAHLRGQNPDPAYLDPDQ